MALDTASEDLDGSDKIDLRSESVLSELAEVEARKPPRSGYLLFADCRRDSVSEQRLAAPEQSKLIAKLWTALDDEERDEWNEKVEVAKQEFEDYLAKHPEKRRLFELDRERQRQNQNRNNNQIPLLTLKRVIQRDPEVKRLSKEALIMINHCASLFVQRVATTAQERQPARKRGRGLSEKDVINTLYADDKYMFVRHAFARCKLGKERTDGDGDAQGPPKKKLKMTAPETQSSESETPVAEEKTSMLLPKKKGTITSFFK